MVYKIKLNNSVCKRTNTNSRLTARRRMVRLGIVFCSIVLNNDNISFVRATKSKSTGLGGPILGGTDTRGYGNERSQGDGSSGSFGADRFSAQVGLSYGGSNGQNNQQGYVMMVSSGAGPQLEVKLHGYFPKPNGMRISFPFPAHLKKRRLQRLYAQEDSQNLDKRLTQYTDDMNNISRQILDEGVRHIHEQELKKNIIATRGN